MRPIRTRFRTTSETGSDPGRAVPDATKTAAGASNDTEPPMQAEPPTPIAGTLILVENFDGGTVSGYLCRNR